MKQFEFNTEQPTGDGICTALIDITLRYKSGSRWIVLGFELFVRYEKADIYHEGHSAARVKTQI